MTTKFDIGDIAFVPVKIVGLSASQTGTKYRVILLQNDPSGETICETTYNENAILTETEVSEYLSNIAETSQKDLVATTPQQKPTFLEYMGMPCAHDDSCYYRCPVCKATYNSYCLDKEQLDGEPFVCDCGTLVCLRQF